MWRLAPLFASAIMSADGVTVGEEAPYFAGSSYDGTAVDLSTAAAQEKGLIIWFYPRAGTGG